MRLTAIWTLPAADLAEKLRRTADWTAQKVARHLPNRVKYWVYIQCGVAAMGPKDVVPTARFMDLLERVPR